MVYLTINYVVIVYVITDVEGVNDMSDDDLVSQSSAPGLEPDYVEEQEAKDLEEEVKVSAVCRRWPGQSL